MTDRQKLRNHIAIAITSRPSLIPELADGSRTVVVVFIDEEVGAQMSTIAADYNTHAHIVVLSTEGKPTGLLSISASDEASVSTTNTLRSTFTFGVLLEWIKSNHDGGPLQFVFDDSPAVEIAEDEFPVPA